jgi:hypothetical protein
MKIYDIISERQETNEGVKSWIGKTALKALDALGAGPSKAAAEELAAYWAKQLHYGQELAPAEKIIGKYANDPKIVKAAKAEADELAKAAEHEVTKKIASKAYRSAADELIFWTKWATRIQIIGDPAYNYFQQVAIAEKKWQAKEITDEQFAAIRQQQMAIMMGKIATNIATYVSVSGTLVGPIKTLRWFGGKGKSGPANIIADMFEGLSIGGKAYIMHSIINGDGVVSDLLSKIFSNYIVQEVFGGWGVEAADQLKAKIGLAQKSDKVGRQDNTATNAAADATSQPAKPKPYDAVSQPSSPNQIKDPVTGEVRLRYPDEY